MYIKNHHVVRKLKLRNKRVLENVVHSPDIPNNTVSPEDNGVAWLKSKKYPCMLKWRNKCNSCQIHHS